MMQDYYNVLKSRRWKTAHIMIAEQLAKKYIDDIIPFLDSMQESVPPSKWFEVCQKKLKILGEKGIALQYGAAGWAECPRLLVVNLKKIRKENETKVV